MTKKVIGWSWYDGDAYLGLKQEDFSEEVWEAVKRDIVEHGYLFCGEDQQEEQNCCPVLDNYRIARFSRRGFAAVMAEAHGATGEYDYARYMESSSIDEKNKVYPDGEPLFDPRVKVLSTGGRCFDHTIKKDLFDRFLSLYTEKENFGGEIVYLNKDCPEQTYLLPVAQKPGAPYYWAGDFLQFFDEDGREFPIILYIDRILSFDSYRAFSDFFPLAQTYFDDEMIFDPDYIRTTCPKDRILLLAVR